MFLDAFHYRRGEFVGIRAEQGDRFAKQVAGDFNPIHDAGERRFCVPGDLLVALVLRYYGIGPRMTFRFRGMVGADVLLRFPPDPGCEFAIADAEGRVYLEVARAGPTHAEERGIERLVREYAAFSGRNFPEFLEPLMRGQGMMFNPDRPLVLYDSMTFDLDRIPPDDLRMRFADAALQIDGRRGIEIIDFELRHGEDVIGSGSKRVVLSGLQPYDGERLQRFIDDYEGRRQRLSG